MNLIPIQQAENQITVQTQTKPVGSLSADEQAISAANVGKFVQDASNREIDALLLYLFSLCGLNPEKYPLEADMNILVDFVLSNYPTFRLNEVREAFKMTAAGKFGDIEHYQNFSPAYFGKVMMAFRKRSQELKSYQQQAREWNKPVQPLSRADEIPDEEMVRLSFENYKKVGNWQLIYPLCYDCLKRHGYGLSIDEGARQRKLFNSIEKGKTMFAETTERQFKQWLTAAIFADFITNGKEINF